MRALRGSVFFFAILAITGIGAAMADTGLSGLPGLISKLITFQQGIAVSGGTVNAAAATSLSFPAAAGAAPTVDNDCRWDTTAHQLECGHDGVNKVMATTTGNVSTATALAANAANCSAGNYPLGTDASGAVESCTADDDAPDSDAEVPDVITVDATGTVGWAALASYPSACAAGSFVSTLADTPTCTSNATTATALASNPTDCGANTFATTIAANGNLTCSAVDIVNGTTGTLTTGRGGTGSTSSSTGSGGAVLDTSAVLTTPTIAKAKFNMQDYDGAGSDDSSAEWTGENVVMLGRAGTQTFNLGACASGTNKSYVQIYVNDSSNNARTINGTSSEGVRPFATGAKANFTMRNSMASDVVAATFYCDGVDWWVLDRTLF